MICFHMYRISLEYLSERNNEWALLHYYEIYFPSKLWTVQSTVCSLHQYTSRPVTLQCDHSSSELYILSLSSVFAPAMHLTSCHSTVSSLQQYASYPVNSTVCSLQQCTWQSCHSTVWSLQRWTGHFVTIKCIRSSIAFHILSFYS